MQTSRKPLLIWLLGAAFSVLSVISLPAQQTTNAVEKPAAFPGGMPALINYMIGNIKYPEAAMKERAEGMIVIKFVVKKDGSIKGIQTISEASQNPRADFVSEAVRVIRAMPRWEPAEAQGKKVSSEMTLPIKFALDGKNP